jgi:hypothetical protein
MSSAALIGEIGRFVSRGDFFRSIDRRRAASGRLTPKRAARGSTDNLHLRRGQSLPSLRQQSDECSRRQGHQALARERDSHMNTETETLPAASVNQSRRTDQSVAPAKKHTVGAKPKVARATKTTKTPQRPGRSSRAAASSEKLSADIAEAMTSRRPSGNDAMPDAAPASRSATARLGETRRAPALGRRKSQNSFGRRSNVIGAWAKGLSPDLYFRCRTQLKNQHLKTT